MVKAKNLGKKIPRNLTGVDYIAFVTITFAAAVIPLLVYMRVINLQGERYDFWTIEGHTFYDFFSSTKALYLVICLSVLIIYLIIKAIMNLKIRFELIIVPLMVYVVMVILSTVFSKYFDVSLFGFTDRWEGALVLLAYAMLGYISFSILNDGKLVLRFFIALLASCFIMALIGLSQFYGADFLQSFEGKLLMLPKAYEHMALGDAIRFNFAGEKIMYTTVYNPNYVGSYSALLLPISIAVYYSTMKKEWWKSSIALIFFIGSFALWLGGMSRAGLLGGIGVFILLAFFFRKRISQNKRMSIILLSTMIITFLIMDVSSGGLVSKEFINTLPSSIQRVFVKDDTGDITNPKADNMTLPNSDSTTGDSTNNEEVEQDNGTRQYIQKISVKNNVFSMITDKETLNLTTIGDELLLSDANGKNIAHTTGGNPISIEMDGFLLRITADSNTTDVTLNAEESLNLEFRKNVFHASDENNRNVDINQNTQKYALKIVDGTLYALSDDNNPLPLLDNKGVITLQPDGNIIKMYDSQMREILSVVDNGSYLLNINNNSLDIYSVDGTKISTTENIDSVRIIYQINVLNVVDQYGSKTPLTQDTQNLYLYYGSGGLVAIDQNQEQIPVIKTGEISTAKLNNNQFEILDSNSKAQVTLLNPITKTFSDPKYDMYSIELLKDRVYVHYFDAVIPMFLRQGRLSLAANLHLSYDDVDDIEKVGFERQERFGSGRGYLWSRSIPLIKNTLIIGHGPDTFAMTFPQHDLAGKINGLDTATVIVDKPHNWYLQLAINTGVISLIAVLVMLGWYWIGSIKKWYKDKGDLDHLIGVAALGSVTGYCITAFFNDSNVSVAPVFWIVLGIGIAFMYKKKADNI